MEMTDRWWNDEHKGSKNQVGSQDTPAGCDDSKEVWPGKQGTDTV